MFHEISERLVAWAATVAGEPIATLGPPSAGTSGRRIGLSLVDVLPHRPAAAARVSRLEVSLRYLATVSAETPVETHRLLGLLTFAAMSRPDFVVDPERPSMQFWLALGVAPQPCLSLRVTAWHGTAGRADTLGSSEPRLLDRRASGVDPHTKNSCAFHRRATDWRPATLGGRPEINKAMTAWRDRC